MLTFENAAVKSGVAKAPASYAASWSVFDNNTGAMRPLGETKGSAESVPAVSDLPATPGTFVIAEVRAVDPPHASWAKPVRTTFRRMENGWKLVGLERMEEMEPHDRPKSDDQRRPPQHDCIQALNRAR